MASIASTKSNRVFRKVYRYRWFYLLMAPGLLYFLIFRYVPMAGLLVAFKDYSVTKGIWDSPWVGWRNFETIFNSPDFLRLMTNTLLISVYRLVFNLLPDLILALLLNEIRVTWFKKIVQTITYGPYFLSWVIVYGLVYSFFSPGTGLVTTFYQNMGWGELNVLANSDLFRPLIILTDVWRNTGFGAIFFLAALATINPELYEAAVVDGAGRWKQIWHITLPGVREVFILLLILRLGTILDAGFDQIYVFLNARVTNVGDILDTWIFRRIIEQSDFSIPAAMGVFKSVIGFVLVIAANRIAKKFGGSGIY